MLVDVWEELKTNFEASGFLVLPIVAHSADLWRDCLESEEKAQPNGNCVLIRRSLLSLQAPSISSFQISMDGNVAARICITLAKSNYQVVIWTSHLESDDEPDTYAQTANVRATQIENIIQHMDSCGDFKELLIWGGDFNGSSREFPEIDRISHVTCLKDVTIEYVSCRTDYHLRALTPIDIIFCAGEYLVQSVTKFEGHQGQGSFGEQTQSLLTRYGSDHCPVGATIRLSMRH